MKKNLIINKVILQLKSIRETTNQIEDLKPDEITLLIEAKCDILRAIHKFEKLYSKVY